MARGEAMRLETMQSAPRTVELGALEAAWRYALVSLAVQRGDEAEAMRWAAEREAAAQAFEAALAEAARWVREQAP
jgi:hypothetical protein